MSVKADVKQERLNEETQQEIEKAGATNFLQAEFYHKFAEHAIGSDDPLLSRVQPNPNIDMNNEAWREALCVTLAYLKRYKMTESIETLRTEFPDTPAKSGFQRKQDLESFFEDVATIIVDMKSRPLEKRISMFSEEAGLPPPKRKEKSTKSRHHHH